MKKALINSFFFLFLFFQKNLNAMQKIEIFSVLNKKYNSICANGSLEDNKIYFEPDKLDIFSQTKFADLIKAREKLPFVLAMLVDNIEIKDKDNNISINRTFHFCEASALNEYLNKTSKFINPVTNSQIYDIKYYLLTSLADKFYFIGKKKDLWNKDNQVKNILLALLISLGDSANSDALLNIGLLFEFSSNPKLDLAEYFYDLAIWHGNTHANYSIYILKHKSDESLAIKYLKATIKKEEDKDKLFSLALTLLTRSNGKLCLCEEATLRACQIFKFLLDLNYKICTIEDLIKNLVETKN